MSKTKDWLMTNESTIDELFEKVMTDVEDTPRGRAREDFHAARGCKSPYPAGSVEALDYTSEYQKLWSKAHGFKIT